MGGTFDPIHNGHLVAASEVANMFDLDEVVFVPTGEPWQKSGKKVSAAEDRYLMTVIATASNPRFKVSRVDIDRSGPTYTVDTLRDLRRFYPGAELFEHGRFVGVTRPGYELDDAILPEVHRERVSLVDIPAMAISSTDCRERAASKRPVWYLVPDGVVQYIAKHGLYVSTSG